MHEIKINSTYFFKTNVTDRIVNDSSMHTFFWPCNFVKNVLDLPVKAPVFSLAMYAGLKPGSPQSTASSHLKIQSATSHRTKIPSYVFSQSMICYTVIQVTTPTKRCSYFHLTVTLNRTKRIIIIHKIIIN